MELPAHEGARPLHRHHLASSLGRKESSTCELCHADFDFPDPAFTGQKNETKREFNIDMVDQRVVFESKFGSKFGQHRRS